MSKIRIGLIGSGGMAWRRARNFQGIPYSKITSIAARNPETGRALANEMKCHLHSDWRSLIEGEELDAVVICTHNALHGEIVTKALENNMHVFTEYPIARYRNEIKKIRQLTKKSSPILRAAHSETVSLEHQALKDQIEGMGALIASNFLRLTPSRGTRPEVLFNLKLSGPPALFFIYHVYPMIDLFGPAIWIESHANYKNLRENGSYDCFLNTLTVGFAKSGIAQWTWAGGVQIKSARQFEHIVLAKGTMTYESENWTFSNRETVKQLKTPPMENETLESQFLRDILEGNKLWRKDLETALHATEIGIAAEESAVKGSRLFLPL